MEQAEDKCNLIWLENLNLRGSYKSVILEYINKRYPHLAPLYREIYQKGSRGYWEGLDAAIRQLAEKRGLPYLRNADSMVNDSMGQITGGLNLNLPGGMF